MNDRLSDKEIRIKNSFFEHQKEFSAYFNALTLNAVILDENNRVVMFTEGFNSFNKHQSNSSPLGKLPGELFHCSNEIMSTDDCGTSTKCLRCGIKNALNRCRQNKGPINLQHNFSSGYSLELKKYFNISVSPLFTEEGNFTLFSLDDIDEIKRIYAQEYSFYHDLLDKVTNMVGAIDLAGYNDDEELRNEGLDIIRNVTDLMQEEIREQKDFLAVESGEYKHVKEPFIVDQLLDSIAIQVTNYLSEDDCKLIFTPKENDLLCESDQTLLRRVIINSLKTAIKECNSQNTVRLDYEYCSTKIVFKIEYDRYIPLVHQMNLFQKFISPQSNGHSIGNYRVRILTEKFLNGHVSFETSKKNGTLIRIHLPLR